MAGVISYNIENGSQLKNNTQQIVDKTAVKLGFSTARKSVQIKIRFKKGASHRSWNSGKMLPSQKLADLLVRGFRAGKAHKRIKARPVFDKYLEEYSDDMREICIRAFRAHDSIQNKAYTAGLRIMRDLKRKIYRGSFNLAPNRGEYANRKQAKGYGDIPLVATKALFEDLEVVIE